VVEIAIQIIRESDTFYWTGSAWSATETDAVSYHPRDWEIIADEFTTEGSADTYTFYIHRAAGTKASGNDEFWYDLAFLQEKEIANEIWELDWNTEPEHIWVSGTVSGESCDYDLLENETQTSKQTGLEQPHFMGWSYDNVNELLSINVGEDPGDLTLECSMRDTCVDFNGKSYVTVDGLQCYTPKRFGVHTSYVEAGVRPTEVAVKNCVVKYTGETGILNGYQPALPYEGGITPDYDHRTPSECTIEGNDVFRFGDGVPVSIRCADTELLTDPDFEDWDSASQPSDWVVIPAGTGTLEQETTDVWRGSSAAKLTCDGSGNCPTVWQDDLYGIFLDSDTATCRVSLWYKTPDWLGVDPFESVFALVVRRYDSSGAGTGPVLQPSGSWAAGGAVYGIPLPQSLTWTNYELVVNRPADYEDYPIYSFAITVYAEPILFKPKAANMSLVFDQASFSEGWSDWNSGTSYGPPTSGIFIASDALLAGGCGNVTIQKNKVDGKQAMINYSAGKNGIVAHNGGGTPGGSLVDISQNEITRASHALVVIGPYGLPARQVTTAKVAHNFIHDTGDDGMWIVGMHNNTPHMKICYNVISNTGDNFIDLWDSVNVEIYNNSFTGNVNEGISIYGSCFGNTVSSNAYILNNIFHQYGTEWETAAVGKRRGAAIGFTLTGITHPLSEGASHIDYNMYYSSSDPTGALYPFYKQTGTGPNIFTRMSFTEWQALGFDANGSFDDPEFFDSSGDDVRIAKDSPCFENGIDLSTANIRIDWGAGEIPFDNSGVESDSLNFLTTFPSDVRFDAQGTSWEQGAYGDPTPAIIDDTASFPTDKSLIGVTAYVVDPTNHRIWKGLITSNIATELYLDEWEPVFNATGYYPGGDLTYYVGYIYLYDKTPVLAFENTQWEKGLTEHELITNNISTANPIYFMRHINHGADVETEANSLSGDRMVRRILSGLHRNFQHEHALLTNQEIRIKGTVYHVVWKRGKFDQ
jgi:hypothetical protein